MIDDSELLRRYAEEGAAEAFGELVRRNVDLVYAAALRRVGDAHRAQDVTQTVFIDLARKARGLRRHPSLVSWLYTSTRFAALKQVRAEQRRLAREQEAHAMQEILRDETALEWERLRPVLDDALHELGERDREIVLLRYFRGLPFADVAQALGSNEGTARMRLGRALDKLGALLARKGITSTATALGVALAAQSGVAAPAGFAASVSGAALSAAAAASGPGAAVAAFVFMSKIKTAAIGVIAVTGLVSVGLEVRANRMLQAESNAVPLVDLGELRAENERLRGQVATIGAGNPDVAALDRLHGRLAVLKARPAGVVDSELRLPRNLGRATPAAAVETFCWALGQRDLDLAASFVTLSDDSPENREAFMAKFSPAVRERYRTPERLCAMAFFGMGLTGRSATAAMQVISVREDGPDQVKIKLWLRGADGREAAGGDTFARRGGNDWAGAPLSLSRLAGFVGERIDPITGDFIPLKPKPVAGKAKP